MNYDRGIGSRDDSNLVVVVARKENNHIPTPTSRDSSGVRGAGAQQRKGNPVDTLPIFVKTFPTLTASDHRDRGGPSMPSVKRRKEIGKSIELSMTVDGALNPDWVELLMGWPKFWSRLDAITELDWDADWSEWEKCVPRVTKGAENRANRLKAIGNGQVPLTVATAWSVLND